MPERQEEDLYSPSFDASYDATDMAAPWNPRSLLLPSFIGGPVTAAILYARNAGFIGQKNERLRIVVLFAAVLLTACIAQVEVTRRLFLDMLENADGVKRLVRFGTQGVILLAAFWVGKRQETRARLYKGTARPLFLPGLGAILAGWALSLLTFLVVAIIYNQVCAALGIQVPDPPT